jgi:hypothetical protein
LNEIADAKLVLTDALIEESLRRDKRAKEQDETNSTDQKHAPQQRRASS